jgi:hypothetical protein
VNNYTNLTLGKVITIKFNNGIEIITRLLSVDKSVLYINKPRVVVVKENQLALVPYLFTGDDAEVIVDSGSIQTVVETLESSAAEYEAIVGEL